MSGYANLKKHQYKAGGKSVNPNGRPKGILSLVGLLKKKLRDYPEAAQMIIDRIILQAMRGCTKSQELILNRVDGKTVDVVHRITEMDGWDLTFTDGTEVDDDDAEAKETDCKSVPNDEDAPDPEEVSG